MGDSQPRRIEEFVAREIALALMLLALVLVQSALLLPTTLSPLLVLMLCRSLLVGPASASRWALYGGLSLDLMASSFLGTHTIALLSALLLPWWLLSRLSRSNWLLPILGVGIGATIYYAVLGLLTSWLVAPVPAQIYGLIVVLPGVLLALIPSLPVYLCMRWLEERRRGEVPIEIY
jgi:hypothetical protein